LASKLAAPWHDGAERQGYRHSSCGSDNEYSGADQVGEPSPLLRIEQGVDLLKGLDHGIAQIRRVGSFRREAPMSTGRTLIGASRRDNGLVRRSQRGLCGHVGPDDRGHCSLLRLAPQVLAKGLEEKD
jgi:hypothetical protein